MKVGRRGGFMTVPTNYAFKLFRGLVLVLSPFSNLTKAFWMCGKLKLDEKLDEK